MYCKVMNLFVLTTCAVLYKWQKVVAVLQIKRFPAPLNLNPKFHILFTTKIRLRGNENTAGTVIIAHIYRRPFSITGFRLRILNWYSFLFTLAQASKPQMVNIAVEIRKCSLNFCYFFSNLNFWTRRVFVHTSSIAWINAIGAL